MSRRKTDSGWAHMRAVQYEETHSGLKSSLQATKVSNWIGNSTANTFLPSRQKRTRRSACDEKTMTTTTTTTATVFCSPTTTAATTNAARKMMMSSPTRCAVGGVSCRPRKGTTTTRVLCRFGLGRRSTPLEKGRASDGGRRGRWGGRLGGFGGT